MYPVYALHHYYPDEFRIRLSLTVSLMAEGAFLMALLYRKGRISRHTMGWSIALWTYTLSILYMTVIGRYNFDDYRVRLELFASYREFFATGNRTDLFGIIGNTLLFIPFAFFAAELFRGKKPVLIAASCSILLTALIETGQYFTHTGTFETDDLMHNAIGALTGILIWKLFEYFRNKYKHDCRMTRG